MSFQVALRAFFQDIRNPQDVYGCFRILFVIQIVMGLTPLSVSKNEKCKNKVKSYLRKSRFGCFSVGLWMLIYFISSIYNLATQRNSDGIFIDRTLSVFADFMFIFSIPLSMAILLLFCLIFSGHLKILMRKMHNLEPRLRVIGVMINHKAMAVLLNLFTIVLNGFHFVLIVCCVYLVNATSDIELTFQRIVSYFMPEIIGCCVSIFFAAFTFKLEQYVRALNMVLKNLAKQWQSQTIKTVPPKQRSLQCLDSFSMYTIVTKSPSEIIQESMEIHQLICEAASTANKYFTYQLLTIISIAFLIIVFDAYYVLETLLGKSKRESKFKTVEFVTFFSCQMILYLIAIISIVEGSNRVIKKSEKTGGIVHSLLNKAKDADVKEKLQQFSMQLLHLKINFTAAGLFNIDRTLYFTISGALTTYLIILLQFTSNTSGPDVFHTSCAAMVPANGTLTNFTTNET